MGGQGNTVRVMVGKLDVEGMVIFKRKLKTMKMGRRVLDLSGCGYRPLTGSCDHGKRTFGFHKIREIY